MLRVNSIEHDKRLKPWKTILSRCFLYNLKLVANNNIQNLPIPLQILTTCISFRDFKICVHSIFFNRQHIYLEILHSSVFMLCQPLLSRFLILPKNIVISLIL